MSMFISYILESPAGQLAWTVHCLPIVIGTPEHCVALYCTVPRLGKCHYPHYPGWCKNFQGLGKISN